MSSQVLFTPKIFKSYETLQGFMAGDKEIKAIKAQTATRANIQISLAKKVVLVAMSPFCFIAGVFFYICSVDLSLVGANNLAIRCKVLTVYFFHYGACIRTIPTYGKNLLVFINNIYEISTSDLYLAKKMERKSISKDRRVVELIYSKLVDLWLKTFGMDEKNFKALCKKNHWDVKEIRNKRKEFDEFEINRFNENFGDINFAIFYGLCLGMSAWFAFLYLNSIQSNQDSLKHIVAVAKQFEKGASRQAGLLHSLFGFGGAEDLFAKLLKLQNNKANEKDISGMDSQNCYKFLNEKDNGIYLLELVCGNIDHAICFIKEDEHKYIFDTQVGLLKVDDKTAFQTYYDSEIKGTYYMVKMCKLNNDQASKSQKSFLSKISNLFSKKS